MIQVSPTLLKWQIPEVLMGPLSPSRWNRWRSRSKGKKRIERTQVLADQVGNAEIMVE